METESPRPGCLVLGLDGLVDIVDIEEQRKRRFVLHLRYLSVSFIDYILLLILADLQPVPGCDVQQV